MAEVTVLFDIKEEPSKEKITEELNWYDIIQKKMLVFYGGKLTFRYKEDDYLVKMGEVERQSRGIKSTYRALPVVEDFVVKNHFKTVKTTNRKNVEKWFYDSNYINDIFVSSKNDREIIFEVLDSEKEDFCDDLEGQGFRFND